MNILLIHQYFLEKDDPGGSRFNEMSKTWEEEGHNVTVLAGMVHYNTGKKRDKHKGKFICKEKYSKNVNVIRCHVSEAYNTNFIGRLWAYFSFVFSSLWGGLFYAKKKYDVILVTSPPLFVGISGYLLSRIKRIPLVFEVRDLWPESAIDTGVLTNGLIIKMAYWFEKFIYKKSRLVNTLTPAFQRILIEEKNVPKEKVLMIPNASDFSLAEEVQKDFDREQFRTENNFGNNLVITYVGAHGVANHLIQLVEAAEILKNEKVLILSIGAGMQQEMLREEVKKRNLTNIRFLDPVPKAEVFKFILASDIGTSVLKKVDTFKTIYSNKTFDYMSCKKPILMMIDGVSRDLVEESKSGFFVEPENPQDFADKVKIYLEKPELLSEQGESGYQYALQHFDRNVLAKRYLEEISF